VRIAARDSQIAARDTTEPVRDRTMSPRDAWDAVRDRQRPEPPSLVGLASSLPGIAGTLDGGGSAGREARSMRGGHRSYAGSA
jgi:hypothetical protein